LSSSSLEVVVAGFRGDSTLAAVEAASGKILEAGLAVVGVGVVPSTHFLADSGLRLDDGIVVDVRRGFAATSFSIRRDRSGARGA
jgi:NAD(P)H-nitrite reductase large subunit